MEQKASINVDVEEQQALLAPSDPHKKAPFWQVALALVTVQTGFGAYGVLIKMFAQGASVNAVVFSFFRDIGCFPVLLTAAGCIEAWFLRPSQRLKRPFIFPTRRGEFALFVALGLTGMMGGQLAYILGIYFANPNVASIYQPAMPVWAAIFSVLMGIEKIPPLTKLWGVLKVGGILLAVGGAVTMAVAKGKGENNDQNDTLGAILSLMNTLLFGFYMALQKKYIFEPTAAMHAKWGDKPAFVTAWSYGFGAVFMAVAAALGSVTHSGLFGFGQSGACTTVANCPHYTHYSNGTSFNATRYFCFRGDGQDGSSLIGSISSSGGASNTIDLFGPSLARPSLENAGHSPFLLSNSENINNMTGICRMKTDTLNIPAAMLGPLAYAIFITSALAYGLISFANKNCETSIVTAFWPLQVMVAIILSYFFLGHQTITALQGCGAAMIILGLASVIASNKFKRD